MLPMGIRMLWVAGDLYEAEGPEGVSLRKLAARLKLSPSALYRHFSSRGELLDAVAAQAYGAMEGYLDRHRKVAPARARLGALTADALDFALGSPNLFKLMFDDARKPGVAHDIVIRHVAALIEKVGREEPEEFPPQDHPRQVAQGWLALIVGAAALHRCGLFDEPALRDLIGRAGGRVLGLN